ncbi:hypothetical protein U1E44_14320 [Arenibacter sp. GZD96]|uniref:hypothetical protein n=1 Tax=Aurantibrevibacter litoralis TaxID=3106030 RepID=UPI002AFDF0B2|nr:hypothetical protein [Arenibacter sp. GZD-96]MEA1787273.1 hypothetical protein [Arenibacter sp. GZD-96]
MKTINSERFRFRLCFLSIICVFLVGGLKLGHSQKNPEYRSMVGFHCSFFGSSTELVSEMELDIEKENHEKIRKLLFSHDTGKSYLAVLVCEALEKYKIVYLTPLEKMRIQGLYDSDDELSFCAGCALYKSYRLKDVLRTNTGFGVEARKWVSKKFSNQNVYMNH